MTEALFALVGLIVGAVAAWLIAGSRARAVGIRAAAELETRLGISESSLAAEQARVGQLDEQLEHARSELRDVQQARTVAETRLVESQKNIEQQKELLSEAEKRLKDAFAALSTDALRHNSEAFAKQTAEKVRPLAEALKRYEEEIKQVEKARQTSYAGLTEQLKALATTHSNLTRETSSLVHALRTPQVKGRWGELQLRRTVEVAGMLENCDYVEQFTVDGDEGRLRPDLLVKLPGNRTIVVDSKVSTNAYLDALGTSDPDVQRKHLARYTSAIREHVRALSSKAYWSQFESTPDFVVMFVPGESFFSAALEQDRTLIEDAMSSRVILASPTTLIALLRTVAYSWQQHTQLENAHKIGEAARILSERVNKFAEHMGNVGSHLARATKTFNEAVSSWEVRILPAGRKLEQLGISTKQGEFARLDRVEATPRSIPSGESREDDESSPQV